MQFFRLCQNPWEFALQQFQTIIVAVDSTDAGKHWKKLGEYDVHIVCRLYWSDVQIHIGEKRLDGVEKIQHFVIKMSGKNI